MNNITWHWYNFDEMPVAALYDYLRLRQNVFIIEQKCIYPDIDGEDLCAQHLLGFTAEGNLLGCLRLLPPYGNPALPTIGRLIIAPEYRQQKLAHQLIEEGLRYTRTAYPGMSIRIYAQSHLKAYYQQHGFEKCGEPFDEDGIEHIEMITTS